ncbi:SpoIIE family protein phosphatase [Streptomyces sp. TLI_146]|uniref:SpoIIE family protein phosphatase n=1 Tax=Streptomyces sp. TLI_146 TaxID=1938858 RepID=UPI000C704385|nr:SpoIIE family protein phosphatase [Streptomyces sp. TLI_146]PKV83691.1 PAS domain S-box-containing protein [Streptomyces sp. TLI_146]
MIKPVPDTSGTVGAQTASTIAALSAEAARLRAERTHRHLLDLATGVLAAQLRVGPAQAREHLEKLSRDTGVSREDLAADVVNGVAGDPEAAPAVDGPPPLAEARRARRALAAAETYESVDESAAALLEGGLAPLGAQSLWLWRRTETGCLRLAGHAGVSAAEAVVWQWIPPGAPAVFHSVVVNGSPCWLGSGPPHGEELPGPGRRAGRALLPLSAQGAVVGLALAVWPDRVDFDAPLRRALTGLVEVAGTVLGGVESEPSEVPALMDVLDALGHPAMVLRGAPESLAPTVEYTNGPAVRSLGGSAPPVGQPLALAFPYVHAELGRLARGAHGSARRQSVPRLPRLAGQGTGAPLLDVRVLPAGSDRTVVLWHSSSDPEMSASRAVGHLEGVALFRDSVAGEGSVWSAPAYRIFGIDRDAPPVPLLAMRSMLHPDDGDALTHLLTTLTEHQRGAVAVLRIIRGDGTLRHVRVAAEPLVDDGVVTAVTGVYQDVSASRRTEAALTATFDQLTAVQKQAAIRDEMALRLQQAIVPETPGIQELPGLSVAARYRPAAREYRVGGDWYDALPLPSGRVLLAVGDIAGHGIGAATGMVALRNALRGLAFSGHTPGRLMEWLNEVALRTSGGPTATAVCALYDPSDRSLRWSSAGHLPLLLLRDGRARLLEGPHDLLLGASPSVTYRETRTPLRRDDTLLLYTDGLIERRHDALDQGLDTLVGLAEQSSACEVEEQVDRLLEAATGDTDDDTSVVAIRVRG